MAFSLSPEDQLLGMAKMFTAAAYRDLVWVTPYRGDTDGPTKPLKTKEGCRSIVLSPSKDGCSTTVGLQFLATKSYHGHVWAGLSDRPKHTPFVWLQAGWLEMVAGDYVNFPKIGANVDYSKRAGY